jgi:hypothetical protein
MGSPEHGLPVFLEINRIATISIKFTYGKYYDVRL